MWRACTISVVLTLWAATALAQLPAPVHVKPAPPITGPAGAGSPTQKGAFIHASGPCGYDFDHFCSAVPPGEGRKWACIRAHSKEVQPVCKKRLAAIDEYETETATKRHMTLAQFRAQIYGEQAKPSVWIKVKKPSNWVPPGTKPAGGTPQPTPAKPAQH